MVSDYFVKSTEIKADKSRDLELNQSAPQSLAHPVLITFIWAQSLMSTSPQHLIHLNLFSQISSFVMISISHSEMLWTQHVCFKHLSHYSCSGIHDLIKKYSVIVKQQRKWPTEKQEWHVNLHSIASYSQSQLEISFCEHVVCYIKSQQDYLKRPKLTFLFDIGIWMAPV